MDALIDRLAEEPAMLVVAPGFSGGLVLAGVLVALATALAVAQRVERTRRGADLSEEDARYFARQDSRRMAGTILMVAIAALMTYGSLIDWRAGRAEGRLFAFVWSAALLLVCILLGLGLRDWFSVRSYAGRQRRALLAERLAALDAERRRLAGRGPDRPGPEGDAGE